MQQSDSNCICDWFESNVERNQRLRVLGIEGMNKGIVKIRKFDRVIEL